MLGAIGVINRVRITISWIKRVFPLTETSTQLFLK